MNHLPRPDFAPYDALRFDIRFYAEAVLPGRDFEAYPEQCGWTPRPAAEWFSTIKQASASFQGFLQSWLYFGVISSFFRRTVDLASFTQEPDDQFEGSWPLLNSLELLNYVEKWLEDINGFQSSDYMASAEYITQARFVHEALKIPGREDQAPPAPPAPSARPVKFSEYLQSWPGGCDPRQPMMTEAQAALFDLIDVVLARGKEIQGSVDTSIHSFAQTQGGSSYEGGAIWDLMRGSGWCPSELTMIFSSFSVAGIYFTSHLKRPNDKISHYILPKTDKAEESSGAVPKSSCSNRRCTLYQLDQNWYKTQHTDSCSGCDDMYVDDDALLGILRQRKIPIVQAIDETSAGGVIKLAEQNDETPYLALSHVWADGLGNLQRNGIPRCQMLRMSVFSRKILPLGANACFWLDTLCCPPDSMNKPEEQNVALDFMRDTYAKAHTVLVLDRWLLKQELCAASTVEALFKVICSPWTRRLWTLQEGALASRLLIASADGLLDPDDEARKLEEQRDAIQLLNVRTDILHRWYTIRKFRDLEQPDLLYALYSSLAFRTTSVLEDEPLCLATLFRFQVSTIAKEKTHEARMLKFWRMFDELPAEMMDHYAARMNIPGFRWAPRSFMSDEDNLFPYSNTLMRHGHWDPAVRTDQGLKLRARGYLMHIGDALLTGPVFVRHHAGFWASCTFSFDLDAIETLDAESRSTTPSGTWVGFSPKLVHGADEVALIYHSSGHLEDWKTDRGEESRITGSVASVQDVTEDGIISVRRFGLFVLAPTSQMTPTVKALEEILMSAVSDGSDLSEIVLLEASTRSVLGTLLRQIPKDQLWLLD